MVYSTVIMTVTVIWGPPQRHPLFNLMGFIIKWLFIFLPPPPPNRVGNGKGGGGGNKAVYSRGTVSLLTY